MPFSCPRASRVASASYRIGVSLGLVGTRTKPWEGSREEERTWGARTRGESFEGKKTMKKEKGEIGSKKRRLLSGSFLSLSVCVRVGGCVCRVR